MEYLPITEVRLLYDLLLHVEAVEAILSKYQFSHLLGDRSAEDTVEAPHVLFTIVAPNLSGVLRPRYLVVLVELPTIVTAHLVVCWFIQVMPRPLFLRT